MFETKFSLRLIFTTILCITFTTIAFSGTASGELPPENHPSLLFGESDLSMLRERIERPPYSVWWSGILSTADAGLDIDFFSLTDQNLRAVYAEELALTGLILEDESARPYREKAAEALETMNPYGNWGQPHSEGKSALSLALAYDWLAGTGYFDSIPDTDATIRDLLYAEAVKMFLHPVVPFMLNNWKIRFNAGMGMTALAIRDYAQGIFTPDFLFASAEFRVTSTLEYQAAPPDGNVRAYAEGPNYLLYSQDCYIPYFAAVKNLTGTDHFHDDAVIGIHNWERVERLPWGETPNFDDASLAYVPGGILAFFYPEDAGIWRGAGMVRGEDRIDSDLREEALVFFDDTIAPEPDPEPPVLFLPNSGQTVFRDGRDENGIWMLFLGEHGVARKHGQGHEHPDPTSFILAAGGEILALDGGYIAWAEHGLVNGAKNHNLILVDGNGPPKYMEIYPYSGGADCYLGNFADSTGFSTATAWTSYREATITRKIIFEGDSTFVIVDRVVSLTGEPRRFDLLIHGNGSSETETFTLTGSGGEWTAGEMKLSCEVHASSPLAIREESAVHSFYYGQELTHSVLDAACRDSVVTFVTRLTPLYPDQFSTITTGERCSQVERKDSWETSFNDNGRNIIVDGIEISFPR